VSPRARRGERPRHPTSEYLRSGSSPVIRLSAVVVPVLSR
jgi:hypothetical protein